MTAVRACKWFQRRTQIDGKNTQNANGCSSARRSTTKMTTVAHLAGVLHTYPEDGLGVVSAEVDAEMEPEDGLGVVSGDAEAETELEDGAGVVSGEAEPEAGLDVNAGVGESDDGAGVTTSGTVPSLGAKERV